MSKDYVELEIRGMAPRTYSNDEWCWRRYIAKSAATVDVPTSHNWANSSTRFEISLVFHRLKKNISNDLDNLAKPVLDTIFFSQRGKRPQTVLHRIDNSVAWKLCLEKRVGDSEEGAGVSVRIVIR